MKTVRNCFPWREAMAVGFGVLKLGTRDFWAMTPKEFEAALRGLYGDGDLLEQPDRSQLVRLMSDFPDDAAQSKHQ